MQFKIFSQAWMRYTPLRTACSAAVAFGVLLFVTQGASASGTITAAEGAVKTETKIIDSSLQTFCECVENGGFSLFQAGAPASKTGNCPECAKPDNDGQRVGPTQVTGTVSGDAHQVTLSSTGSVMSTGTSFHRVVDSLMSGTVRFTVTDAPTNVGISVSMNFSGGVGQTPNQGIVQLLGPNGVLGQITQNNKNERQDSLPTGPLDPGQYTLLCSIQVVTNETTPSQLFGYSMTVMVAIGGGAGEFHWINPNGGDFSDPNNWNPAQVPGAMDTAIFDLAVGLSLEIVADHAAVDLWRVRGMNFILRGSASAKEFSASEGALFELKNGATFSTIDTTFGGEFAATVFVEGAGTRWTNSNRFSFGGASLNGPVPVTLVVRDGGVLDAQLRIDVGQASNPGMLFVDQGGLVQTPDCSLRGGSVEVRGEGVTSSRFEVASHLDIGGIFDPNLTGTGPGSMLIVDGGTVRAQQVAVGDRERKSDATLTISGVGSDGRASSLILGGASPSLLIGGATTTQLEVKDGAMLSTSQTDTSELSRIGSGLLVGKVLIHGKNGSQPAIWAMADNGFFGIGSQVVPSELVVQDGGSVTGNGALFVGANPRELGRISISGAESSLSADNIIVGRDGDGELMLSDGGHVTAAVGRVGSDPSSNSGQGGGGTGFVTIQGTPLASSEWHLTTTCMIGAFEPGTVRLMGTTIGPFSVGGATLRVDGTLTVDARGGVMGNGTLAAGQRVVNGGFISPGLSPGVIVIEGDYEQTPDGMLKMEAAGLNTGEFDILHVTGKSTLGGTMEVTFLNGYLPKTGDAVPFLVLDGEVTGDFAQITFPQLASGFEIKTEMVNGKYQLTALKDAVRRFEKELFRGLLVGDPASHQAAGFFTIHTTARGGLSARFVLGGRSFAVSGKFDSAGKFSKTIPRQGGSPLTINLELAVINGDRVITGTIVDGNQSIPISADQGNAFNAKTNPAPQAGKYTALLQFDPAATDAPHADGIGTVVISKSGAVRFQGTLADGTHLSQGTVLSKSGEWPLYVLLYKKQGSLFGELQFRENTGSSDFDGTLEWSRPPTPKDKVQTAGFLATLSAIGSKYVAPPARPAVLDFPNGATASLSDADLTPALTKSLGFTPPAKFAVLDPAADNFSLSTTVASGLLSARFIHPATGLSTKVQGVVFQKQNLGSGFFLRPGVIGSFAIHANP